MLLDIAVGVLVLCASIQANLRYVGRDALAVLLGVALRVFSGLCACGQADLRYIGRDALAVLLGTAVNTQHHARAARQT